MKRNFIRILVVIFFIAPVVVVAYYLLNEESMNEQTDENIGEPNITEGLLAHWAFMEAGGTDLRDSVNNHHGEIYGAKRELGALVFDGVDDFVEVKPPFYFEEQSKGSISVWFKVNRIPTDNGIMPIFYYGAKDPCTNMFDAANQGIIIEVGHSPVHRQSKRLYFTMWSNGCNLPSFCFDSNDPIIEGQWYHFVGIVGEEYNTGYLNGKEMENRRYNFGSKNTTEFFSDTVVDEVLWIGKGFWDSEEMYYDGMIGEIRIYDRPLSSQEVQELFNVGSK